MLIRFSVENFLSFKERVIFSMFPSRGTLKKNHVNKSIKKIGTLKFTSVFCANASGKSNLIRAIHFGQKLVISGDVSKLSPSNKKFKLDKTYEKRGTRFEYEIQTEHNNYAYGFIINNNNIEEEWLYSINNKTDAMLYERKGRDFSFSEKLLKKSGFDNYIEIISNSTPNDSLFLSYINKININEKYKNEIKDFFDAFDWFKNSLNIIYPNSKSLGFLFELTKSHNIRALFIKFLKYFDTGICDIEFKPVNFDSIDIPDELKNKILSDLKDEKSEKHAGMINDPFNNSIIFIEKSNNEIVASKLITKRIDIDNQVIAFDPSNEESDGTKRLFDLIPLFIDLIDGGNVIIIDEMERSLHPNLIYDFIELYINALDKDDKSKRSQLIMATHESSLLTQKLLRKDEIWFISKNKQGASTLNSLQEYNVRFDKELRNSYLKGRFNGVPNLGEPEDLPFN